MFQNSDMFLNVAAYWVLPSPADNKDSETNSEDSFRENEFTIPLERGFEKVATPFKEFARCQTTSSIVLMVCAGTALVLAKSAWTQAYEAIVDIHLGIHIGEWSFDKTLRIGLTTR
ncbi:MAG: Na+/H+ antiporter NhaA [Acidiferrobacterales bacterium]